MDFSLKVTLNDVEIKVPTDQMLIEGSKLYFSGQETRDSVCFLAVFRNPQKNKTPSYLYVMPEVDEWTLGTVVMNQYYTLFDASTKPFRMGLGKRAAHFIASYDKDTEPSEDYDST